MIHIGTAPSNRIRIHTTDANGQTLSKVEISLETADKMIEILKSCCREICPICQNHAQYRPSTPPVISNPSIPIYSVPQHREAGPAHPGPQAGGGCECGSPGGGGHGPV